MEHRLIITGPPATKKNHSRIVQPKGWKHPRLLPSKPAVKWEQAAVWQLKNQWRQPPVGDAVSVCALVYREKNIGDLCGYLQAIGDALEKGGVIVNDRLIASWDGSRLLKDPANPRVEIEIRRAG